MKASSIFKCVAEFRFHVVVQTGGTVEQDKRTWEKEGICRAGRKVYASMRNAAGKKVN